MLRWVRGQEEVAWDDSSTWVVVKEREKEKKEKEKEKKRDVFVFYFNNFKVSTKKYSAT